MADFSAQQLVLDDLGIYSATQDASPCTIPILAYNDTININIKMRGIDSGTSTYTCWNVNGIPDPNGLQATALNTSPTLVGAIVVGSGVVVGQWRN